MDNTVNGLRYKIKFEICVKNMIVIILIIQLPRHFSAEADTKKFRYTLAKASAFADCRGEFRMLNLPRICKNNFCKALFQFAKVNSAKLSEC